MSQKMISCKACGKEIAASAKTCPECGEKNKKPIYKKWWFWAVIVVVLIAVASSGGKENAGETTQTNTQQVVQGSSAAVDETPAVEYVEYHVNTLMADLEQNALKAKNTYGEQYVLLTGRLSNIDASGDYINLLPDDEWAFIGVQCYVQNDEQLEKVASLTIGDVVTVKGKITDVGEVLGYSLKIDDIVS